MQPSPLEPVDVVDEAPPARTGWRVAMRRACRRVAVVAFLLVIAIAALLLVPRPGESLGWTTLVLGGWVVRWLDLSVILAVVGVVTLVLARLAARADPDPSYRPSRTAAKVALLIAVPMCLMGTVLQETQDTYTVLEPTSPGGCSLVTYEASNSTSSRGTFGIVQPGSTSVEWIGTVSSMAGFRPFDEGSYELVWDGEAATLDAISQDPAYAHVSNEPIVCEA